MTSNAILIYPVQNPCLGRGKPFLKRVRPPRAYIRPQTLLPSSFLAITTNTTEYSDWKERVGVKSNDKATRQKEAFSMIRPLVYPLLSIVMSSNQLFHSLSNRLNTLCFR